MWPTDDQYNVKINTTLGVINGNLPSGQYDVSCWLAIRRCGLNIQHWLKQAHWGFGSI